MSDLPEMLVQGERARLFPVLAETSKEGRTLSIILACIENVFEFGQTLLADLNIRVGSRTKIEIFTEVVFAKNDAGAKGDFRPDGLIVVQTGSKRWTAMVEAKVGKNELYADQIENYLEIAKQHNVDALITFSNQFAAIPTHHPVPINQSARKKADLYHFSWMCILTQAKLLLDNSEIEDVDQQIILNEMVRFLSHDSAGVRSFTQMPNAWNGVVATTQAGGTIHINAPDTKEVIGAWHQEGQDLCLILSRQLSRNVSIRIPRSFLKDPAARAKADAQMLNMEKQLQMTLVVPNAASPLEVTADLQTRSIIAAMKLKAPTDKKSTKARLNWLLRQISKGSDENIHIRLIWPGRASYTQFTLKQLREAPEMADEKLNTAVTTFEVLLVKDCGARFAQRKNFIVELEKAVPDFYEQVGQYLKTWQPPAPKLKEEKSDPADVGTKAIQQEADSLKDGKQSEELVESI